MRSWIAALLWKDAKMFAADRQVLVMSFVIPVVIASILGWLDSKAGGPPPRVFVLITDADRSAVSKAVLARFASDPSVQTEETDAGSAARRVREEDVSVAITIPAGFGTAATAALTGGAKPSVSLLYDPSKPIDAQIAKGAFFSDASGAVARSAFGSLAGDGSPPFTVAEKLGGAAGSSWSHAAHDYAGFGLQGLLFFAIESAVSLARERKQGIWRRLRSSPVPTRVVLFSRALSTALIALGIILALFGVGALLFGIRILGSLAGFACIAVATALVASTFSLLVTSVGKTESQSRGISILLILVMLATGGAWFPMQQMPDWVQKGANFLPVRWAVEGFDAVTWRGLDFAASMRYAGILAVFALVFGVVALIRFKEE